MFFYPTRKNLANKPKKIISMLLEIDAVVPNRYRGKQEYKRLLKK